MKSAATKPLLESEPVLPNRPVSYRTLLIKALLVAFICLPPLAILFILPGIANNIPVGDEWELTPLIVKLHTGGFTWNDFWLPHFEHRIPFLRLVILILAKLFGWDTNIERYFGLALQLASLVLLWQLSKLTLKENWRIQLAVVLPQSLLLFSAVQWETWAHGLNIAWFLLNFATIGTSLVVNEWPGRWWSWLVAALATLTATYVIFGGIVLWPLVLAVMLVRHREWRKFYIILWALAGAVAIGLYFYNYQNQATLVNPDVFFFIKKPLDYATFVLTYLGSPLGSSLSQAVNTSMWFGLLGVIILGAASGWLILISVRAKDQTWLKLLPWLQISLLAVLDATLTGVGRGVYGAAGNLGRYNTNAILFWIGFSAIIFLALKKLYLLANRQGRGGLVTLTALSIIVIIAGYTTAYIQGYNLIKQTGMQAEYGLSLIYDYPTAPAEVMETINFVNLIRDELWSLDQYKEGPFRTTASDNFKKFEQRWQERLQNTTNYTYPLEVIKPVQLDKVIATDNAGTLKFTAARNPGATFQIDATKLRQTRHDLGWNWDTQIIDIQSKSALYAMITWNAPTETLVTNRFAMKGLEDEASLKHFRLFVPPNVNSFKLDLFYRTSRPTDDEMKIMVYDHK
jgi:hypothetical protein